MEFIKVIEDVLNGLKGKFDELPISKFVHIMSKLYAIITAGESEEMGTKNAKHITIDSITNAFEAREQTAEDTAAGFDVLKTYHAWKDFIEEVKEIFPQCIRSKSLPIVTPRDMFTPYLGTAGTLFSHCGYLVTVPISI